MQTSSSRLLRPAIGDVTGAIEVVTVRASAVTEEEHLVVTPREHPLEVSSIRVGADLDPGRLALTSGPQQPDYVLGLGLDEVEIRGPVVSIPSESGEQVRESRNAHALFGLVTLLLPERLGVETAGTADRRRR